MVDKEQVEVQKDFDLLFFILKAFVFDFKDENSCFKSSYLAVFYIF